jgi:hypothetical protein
MSPFRRRPKLTYANAMSTLAVFLVLAGGTALAAGLPKGSVSSASVKNGSLRSADLADRRAVRGVDVADGSLTAADLGDRSLGGRDFGDGSLSGEDLARGTIGGVDFGAKAIGLSALGPGAVDSAKVADGGLAGADVGTLTVTGLDILESSLGNVPDAAKLTGRNPNQFINRGRITEGGTQVQEGNPPGKIDAHCNAGERILAGGPANVSGSSFVAEDFPGKGEAGEDVWTVRIVVPEGATDPFSVSLICFKPGA